MSDVSAPMKELGIANGVKWYWAEPGRFVNPGVYYWDGKTNVLVIPATASPIEQAQPSAAQAREALDNIWNEPSDKPDYEIVRAFIDATERPAGDNGGKTGWPAGMLQDDSRKLSQALANTPDARMHAREAADAWANVSREMGSDKVLYPEPEVIDATPVLSDAQIDLHIDAVLIAGGSSLKHYSMEKTKVKMRRAMRSFIAAAMRGDA